MASFLFIACEKENNAPVPELPPLPENVTLAENTQQLNSIHLENFISVDSTNSVIEFSANMHESQIPEVGQILLQFTPNKQFPYGFLGKVESVTKEASATKSGDVIKVKTGPASLMEAFLKLKVNEQFVLKHEDEFPSTKGIEFDKVISGGLAWCSTYNLIVDFDLKEGINFVSLSCTNSFDLHAELNIRVEANNDEDSTYLKTPIGPEIPLPAPVAAIAIQPTIQFMQGFKLSGSCGLTIPVNYTTSDSWTLTYDNGVKQLVRKEGTSEETPVSKIFDIKNSSFSLEGEVFGGIFLPVELKLFGSEHNKITVEPYGGLNLAGKFDINLEWGDKGLYSRLKETSVESSLTLGVGAEAEFLKIFSFEIAKVEMKIPLGERYLFPEFKDNGSIDNKTSFSAVANVERDLIFPLGVGFGVYNKKRNGVDSNTAQQVSQHLVYWSNMNFANPLTADLEKDSTQEVKPYVKLGNLIIKADWDYSESSLVGTWVSRRTEHYGNETEDDTNSWDGEIIVFTENTITEFRSVSEDVNHFTPEVPVECIYKDFNYVSVTNDKPNHIAKYQVTDRFREYAVKDDMPFGGVNAYFYLLKCTEDEIVIASYNIGAWKFVYYKKINDDVKLNVINGGAPKFHKR